LTSVIGAGGAYHHVLADGVRVLVEGYYPEARPLRPTEAAELRAAWVFGARYVHLLTEPDAVVEAIEGIELLDPAGSPVPLSSEPRAGAVWTRVTRLRDGTAVLQLVDLRAQRDDRWDALRVPVTTAAGWQLRWSGAEDLVAMSPWTDGGRARPLTMQPNGSARLPTFRRWLVVVDRYAYGD
jgi:hypothetical protein